MLYSAEVTHSQRPMYDKYLDTLSLFKKKAAREKQILDGSETKPQETYTASIPTHIVGAKKGMKESAV